jgi:cell division initiation protein
VTLTPLDIHNKEFKRVLRGYSESEVDEFLDQLVKEFEALIRENGELKDQLDDTEQSLVRYRTVEDSLNKTLLLAQQAAEEVRLAGEKEAGVIRERAEMDAQRLLDETRVRAKQAVNDYGELRREAELFRLRIKTMLQAQLEIFQEAELKEAESGTAPFAVPPRAAAITARYSDDDGEDGDRLDRRANSGREGVPRPSLWGEPASAGQAAPVRGRPVQGPDGSGEERPGGGAGDEEEDTW